MRQGFRWTATFRWMATSLLGLALAAPLAAKPREIGTDATSVVSVAIPDLLLAQLLLLADDACEVRYVPGTLDRAAHVETWLRGLAIGAARRTRHPARLVGVVLGREEWQQAGLACPYGVPCSAGTRVIALPAAGDSATVTFWRTLLGGLPSLGGVPLMGTADEAASLAPADAFASLVVSRDLVAAAGMRGDEAWVADLLAHALSLDAALQEKSGRAADLAGFWETVRVRYGPQGVPAADAFARDLRHQARLFLAAQALLGSEGRLPMRSLRKMQEKGGGVVRASDLRAEWPNALSGIEP